MVVKQGHYRQDARQHQARGVSVLEARYGGSQYYHDSLALILYDMAGSADFITTSKTQKHELIRGIYGLLLLRGGGVELAFGGHVRGVWVVVVELGYNDGVLVVRRSAFLTRSALFVECRTYFIPSSSRLPRISA